ncbi:hypothetical protein SPHINGOAX6_70543 [Sphingomonas sp. AX6]|nr:hypothetical protein SPHINGOAX6_70543 [Sphingomonas sp. AX6]
MGWPGAMLGPPGEGTSISGPGGGNSVGIGVGSGLGPGIGGVSSGGAVGWPGWGTGGSF